MIKLSFQAVLIILCLVCYLKYSHADEDVDVDTRKRLSLFNLISSSDTCMNLIKQLDWIDQTRFGSLMPNVSFVNMVKQHIGDKKDVMLADVTSDSWALLENQVIGLRKTSTNLTVFAVAHDDKACEYLKNASSTIPCWFDARWVQGFKTYYTAMTKKSWEYNGMHGVMLGRMSLTFLSMCLGYNVFLTDSDVIWYQDPLRYGLDKADIMITSTGIPAADKDWGGTFLADQPDNYYTLNNGVVFFRNTDMMKNFVLSLAITSANSLKMTTDVAKGFLQITFNSLLVERKLQLFPCRYNIYNKDLVKYNSNPPLGGNPAGDCYDCYWGHLWWQKGLGVFEESSIISIGVFPVQRFTSHCTSKENPCMYTCMCINIYINMYICIYYL